MAVPFYGVGVFMPIMVMGLAIRKHLLVHSKGRARAWGTFAASFAAVLAGIVFIGQIVGKWAEGGSPSLILVAVPGKQNLPHTNWIEWEEGCAMKFCTAFPF